MHPFPGRLLDGGLALLWLTMGLYCKILGLVPRHQAIVGAVLGDAIAPMATLWIGVGETLLAIWIAVGRHRRAAAVIQIFLILLMNVLELWFAAKLLLWGPLNFVFAFLLCLVIYWNGFHNRRVPHP